MASSKKNGKSNGDNVDIKNFRLLASKEELKSVTDDVKIVKADVTDMGKQQNDHEGRISILETA